MYLEAVCTCSAWALLQSTLEQDTQWLLLQQAVETAAAALPEAPAAAAVAALEMLLIDPRCHYAPGKAHANETMVQMEVYLLKLLMCSKQHNP